MNKKSTPVLNPAERVYRAAECFGIHCIDVPRFPDALKVAALSKEEATPAICHAAEALRRQLVGKLIAGLAAKQAAVAAETLAEAKAPKASKTGSPAHPDQEDDYEAEFGPQDPEREPSEEEFDEQGPNAGKAPKQPLSGVGSRPRPPKSIVKAKALADPIPKAQAPKKLSRYEFDGFAITSVIRTLAGLGWTQPEILFALDNLGVCPAEATVKIQFRAGQKGEGVPAPLSDAGLTKLEKLREIYQSR